jgi:hypothetical protein
MLVEVSFYAAVAFNRGTNAGNDAGRVQATAVRDLFNPFGPVALDPACLTWDTGTVPAIARRIYAEREFHGLPILADALTEAGCTDSALLDHYRGPGPHVLGCWGVDLVLDKG